MKAWPTSAKNNSQRIAHLEAVLARRVATAEALLREGLRLRGRCAAAAAMVAQLEALVELRSLLQKPSVSDSAAPCGAAAAAPAALPSAAGADSSCGGAAGRGGGCGSERGSSDCGCTGPACNITPPLGWSPGVAAAAAAAMGADGECSNWLHGQLRDLALQCGCLLMRTCSGGPSAAAAARHLESLCSNMLASLAAATAATRDWRQLCALSLSPLDAAVAERLACSSGGDFADSVVRQLHPEQHASVEALCRLVRERDGRATAAIQQLLLEATGAENAADLAAALDGIERLQSARVHTITAATLALYGSLLTVEQAAVAAAAAWPWAPSLCALAEMLLGPDHGPSQPPAAGGGTAADGRGSARGGASADSSPL
ncbi:hypothetical protein Rsub_01107 [Raphidocelis subcapitata]|uniref:Uncharacterized protein n=1 Tax=Raphidocelis subcapitata TaxID=307507 RepID=A0A2V0NU93_9CHLO|nr:hypothetical protein Rsub_01107 [Raphidocelis subcapitata]|eukprot:GBF88395.1 hypothetical protein Rsub_01107 [Raphidocelis subcapitata]